MTNARITGWGMYAPERVMTNDEIATMVDTNNEWIVSRTGIRERRIAADDETTTSLSVRAARDALAVAGLDPAELDLVILATCTPDYPLPATSVTVATELGATSAAGFDLQAACSGFLYALATGTAFVRSGMYRNVMVLGVEIMSRFLNWNDRTTCVLFGDGAGAVLLEASDEPGGLVGVELYSDGTGCEAIIIPAGGAINPASHETVDARQHALKMLGSEVYKYATRQLGDSALAVLRRTGLSVDEIDQFVFHQANLRIINSVQKQFGIPDAKTFVNIEKYGNTSAASVPMALTEAVASGRVNVGDRVLMVAFGGGYTAGAAVVEWTADPTRAFLAPGSQTRMGQPQRQLAEVGA